MIPESFPIGSRWYMFGRHWTLAGHIEGKSGLSAVVMQPDKPTTPHGRRGIAITVRCLERRATRTEREEVEA